MSPNKSVDRKQSDELVHFQPGQHSGDPGMEKYLLLARQGDLAGVKRLLKKDPAMLNAKSAGHNRTLLWEATRLNRTKLVEYLVEQGADVNIPGRQRHESFVLIKPYVVARTFRRQRLAEYLLQAATEVDIYTACYLGDEARVAELLKANPSLINREQPEESVWFVTPLHHALSGEHKEIVELLLRNGAKVKPYSELLLDIVLRRGRNDLLELLFEHGASARSIGGADLPLESRELTELLLKHGADVNKRAWGDWPPVAYVSRGDKGEHPEKVKTLLELGADPNACNPSGMTAMHAAAKAGFVTVLEVLIDYGADINAKMKDGSTPLALALKAKRKRAADFLIKHGGER
jgi:ankyrin repeat protein